MNLDLKKYHSLLSSDTKLLGDLLSSGLDNYSPKLPKKERFNYLTSLVKEHRIYPVVYKVLSGSAETLDNPGWKDLQDALKHLNLNNNFRMLQKTASLAIIASHFKAKGVPFLSIKGPVLSKLLYNDFATKASIDLDILVDKKYWNESVASLIEQGFIQKNCNYKLNRYQKKYLLNHFHHLGFYHPQQGILLELHWRLTSNKYLLTYEFDELYQNPAEIDIANQSIKTPGPTHLIIYLMVHGASHAWSRIDWLYEFAFALLKYPDCYSDILTECKKQKLEKIFYSSAKLCNIIFHTNFEEREYGKSQDRIIRYCIKSINHRGIPNHTKPLERLMYKRYIAGLKNGFRYRLAVWTALGTNTLDWETIKLPKRFFFLYYFLRPFLVAANALKKRSSSF